MATRKWDQWAKRLRSRHARITARRTAESMRLVLPRRPLPPMFINIQTRAQFTIAPTLVTTVQRESSASVRVRTQFHTKSEHTAIGERAVVLASPPKAMDPPAGRAFRPILRTQAKVTSSLGGHSSEIVTKREVRRTELNLVLSRSQTKILDEGTTLSPARRVRERMRRREEGPAETGRVFKAAQPSAMQQPKVDALAASPAISAHLQARLPQFPNVDALATQVMQQIDRRLIAYRERMGRA